MYKDCALTMSVFVFVRVRTPVWASVSLCLCVSVCLCVHRLYTDLFQNKHARTHTHTCIHTHMHTHTYAHTHLYIHTHTYTPTNTGTGSSGSWKNRRESGVFWRENTHCHHGNVLRNMRLYVWYEYCTWIHVHMYVGSTHCDHVNAFAQYVII